MSHRISAARRPSSGVFFNRLRFGFGLAQLAIADLFADFDELLDQLSKTLVFLQLAAGLRDSGPRGNDSSHGLSRHRTSEGVGGAVALISLLGTVARRFAAFTETSNQRTWTHFANLGELGFQLVAFEKQGVEFWRSGHIHLTALYAVR